MDTVFGCTGRLWPLMHRLADIVGRLRGGKDITHEAGALAESLEAWPIETPPPADAYLEAMCQIARAYKYCGLLLLRKILSDHYPDEATGRDREIYRAAFDSVLRVCVLSTPMSTLTWPLYVVGKFATSTSDRTVIMHIFSQFLEKHHMKVVEGARNAVEAYWGQGERNMNWEPPAPVLLG
ncbi:fungal specific transcription factor domain-containing protein [Penicillium atrosanguineum]|nr:fungal specific transcription factor domain-containing protein [Penicillium atrosanguineum]